MSLIKILTSRLSRALTSFYLAYLTANFPLWSSVFFVTGISQLIYSYYRSLTVDPKGRAVLITGCDTGFGHSLAKKLHAMEFIVYACCFDKKSRGATCLQEMGNDSGRLHVIQMDITNQKDVDEARRYVESHLSDQGLWGLVNNAGILGSNGCWEWLKMEEIEQTFTVNLVGTIRVTKAFLPLIRKKQGRIVNMSSLLGRAALMFTGAYTTSKFAVEGFSDILRAEMKPFKVGVVIIEPGNYLTATGIFGEKNKTIKDIICRSWQQCDESIKNEYGKEFLQKVVESGQALEQMAETEISLVVNAMTDAVYRAYPKDRYLQASIFEKIYTTMVCFLPSFLGDPLKEMFLDSFNIFFKTFGKKY